MSIYFIACGGFLKVGYSTEPEKRTANLFRSTSRYSAPRAAYLARGTQDLLGWVYGSKTDEARLHRAIEEYAAGCEWFLDEPALRTYLASLSEDVHDADFLPLTREAGPAWETLPHGERGGCNAELAMQMLERRRSA